MISEDVNVESFLKKKLLTVNLTKTVYYASEHIQAVHLLLSLSILLIVIHVGRQFIFSVV